MKLFALTVFLSAFLLFQVQPIIGKFILPWFGSTPGVWTACLLFFQILLLAGYAYAHLIVSTLTPRRQAATHLVLLGLALIALPITPSDTWKPLPGDDPTRHILLLLLATVGAPFLLLSATGPLLQGWFSRLHPDRSPYRLYALSNLGSLLALVTYPLFVERYLRLEHQTVGWSVGWVLYGLAAAACAARLLKAPAPPPKPEPAVDGRSVPRPHLGKIALWVALAACGSGLLMATTNHLCQDVASVPLLWVLPLGLYLVSFIICFDHDRWYYRPVFGVLLPLALAGAVHGVRDGVDLTIATQVGLGAFALFVCCMCCHGELVRRKPDPGHLTLFYLAISAGGAIGGLFVAVVSPAIFPDFFEYPLLLVACYGLVVGAAIADLRVRRGFRILPLPAKGERWSSPRFLARSGLLLTCCAGIVPLAVLLTLHLIDGQEKVIHQERNFYGVIRIKEYARDTVAHDLTLVHGQINHGSQYQDVDFRPWPTTYYGPRSGIGLALRWHPARYALKRQFRIGVIGLGTGTLAAYANADALPFGRTGPWIAPKRRDPGDSIAFYEINPRVEKWSRQHFTYLSDAKQRGAVVTHHPGDARIVMERQMVEGAPQEFDVLAVDAFSGDAIPVHLLTDECLKIYLSHLAEDGILAFHITNRFLHLRPVVEGLARVNHLEAVYVEDERDLKHGTSLSKWMLLTRNREFLEIAEVSDHRSVSPTTPIVWTDDFSSLIPVLRSD